MNWTTTFSSRPNVCNSFLFAAGMFLTCLTLPAAAGDGGGPVISRPRQVFDEVWETVARLHYDRDFDAKNRSTLYDRFLPEVLQSGSDEEIADHINRMLREIGDSHIRLRPPPSEAGSLAQRAALAPRENPGAEARPDRETGADPGFEVLSAGDDIVVHAVDPDADAARAGLRPGDKILAVDDIEIKPEEPADSPWLLIVRSLLSTGRPESDLRLKLERDGVPLAMTVKRRELKAGALFRLGLLSVIGNYRSRQLPDKIGYVAFSAFIPDIVPKFRRDLAETFADADGLIIDLRGNPGGMIFIVNWLASWCGPEPLPLGVMVINGVTLAERSSPQPGAFAGPLAILIDRDSCSAAEIFAAALQDAGRAVLIGEPTPGKCLPSSIFALPSGFRLQTVTGDCTRPAGGRIEGVGLTPDFAAPNRPGRDEALEKAVDYLKSRVRPAAGQ